MPELTPKQEEQWRRVIKKGFLILSESQKKEKLEEEKLKRILRKFRKLQEVKGTTKVADSVVHPNTGINVLDDLLKNIIKTIEKYYKNQSTDEDQRESFRYHFLVNFKNALQPINVNRKASLAELKNKLQLKVKDIDDSDITSPADMSKFIPARPEDEKEAIEAKEEKEKEDSFVRVKTSDPSITQGANFAEKAFQDTETQILAAYEDLTNPKDADMFYDYGLTNLKLYFDKFEAEMTPGITGEEPESSDYTPPEELTADATLPEPEELGA